MLNTIHILHGILIAWLLANFEPWTKLVSQHIKTRIPQRFTYIRTAITCFRCLSFWTVLFLSFNVYDATAAAIIAYSYDRIINSLKTYI